MTTLMAGIYQADGTRVAKSAFPKTAVTDPEYTVDEALFTKERYSDVPGYDKDPEGSIWKRAFNTGDVLRQSDIDALYGPVTVDSVTPATGSTAGGDAVTLKGSNLDGVTDVTFGGTSGANVAVVDQETVTVDTPAGTAGDVDVVVTDDSGSVTVTDGFTYA